jgi:hypothetical protein
MRRKARLLELARRRCANHLRPERYGRRDYCRLEPPPAHRGVLAVRARARCRYFRAGVLSLAPQLEAIYWAGPLGGRPAN